MRIAENGAEKCSHYVEGMVNSSDKSLGTLHPSEGDVVLLKVISHLR